MIGKTSKIKFSTEFVFNSCSSSLLWQSISSATGLADWFADKVQQNDDLWLFIWDGSEQYAHRLLYRTGSKVRFRWVGEQFHNTFFEFAIHVDELTGVISLVITDFADADEVEDAKILWQKQVSDLQHKIGA